MAATLRPARRPVDAQREKRQLGAILQSPSVAPPEALRKTVSAANGA